MNIQNSTSLNVDNGISVEDSIKTSTPRETIDTPKTSRCEQNKLPTDSPGQSDLEEIYRQRCGGFAPFEDFRMKVKEYLLKEFPFLAEMAKKEGSAVDSCPGENESQTNTCPEGVAPGSKASCEKNPGTKSYQEVIRDLVKPGADGKIGEKELQNGLIKFALYQLDQRALEAYEKAYDGTSSGENRASAALAEVRDNGLLSASDADWVNSFTRFAAEFDRAKIGGENRIAVSLSDGERYSYEDAITWAEANLAYVIGGSYDIESVPVAVNDKYSSNNSENNNSGSNDYLNYVQTNFPSSEETEEVENS